MSTMTPHNVKFEDSWWQVVGMIAQAMCTDRSEVVRTAVRHLAKAHGLAVVDGEVVIARAQHWAAESTAEEKIHGGGESTGEDPIRIPGGGPATRSKAEDPA